MARKSLIMQLALATIIGMPLVALIVDHFSETVDLRAALIGDGVFWRQLLYGSIAGLIIAVIAQLLISSPLLSKVNTTYANLLGRFNLNWSEITFVSLCAGVGEELLFRGAIQPFMGIPLTSVLFVAIHGYLSPKNWRLSIYGIYMSIAIAVLGYFTVKFGLLAAIIGHTVIDIYLLHYLQKNAGGVSVSENQRLTDEEFPEDEF
jgi:membrane protease YdiL (CAAX protease family)